MIDGTMILFGVQCDLVPLFGRAGFLQKMTFTNRTDKPLAISLRPQVEPGKPLMLPLKDWAYGVPAGTKPAKKIADNAWANDRVRLTLFSHSLKMTIPPKGRRTAWVAVVATKADQTPKQPQKLADWDAETHNAWARRLAWAVQHSGHGDRHPRLGRVLSAIGGQRIDLHLGKSRIRYEPLRRRRGPRRGAMCAYVWDFGGYIPAILALEFPQPLPGDRASSRRTRLDEILRLHVGRLRRRRRIFVQPLLVYASRLRNGPA